MSMDEYLSGTLPFSIPSTQRPRTSYPNLNTLSQVRTAFALHLIGTVYSTVKIDADFLLCSKLARFIQIAQNTNRPKEFRRTPSGQVDCRRVLKKSFQKPDFRGKQKEVVDHAVRGSDCLVVAPTGSGKSICFQVPALAEEHGISIVVSPLLALMKNQVDKLVANGVPVLLLSSESTPTDKAMISKDLASGHPRSRLLYITPEKLCGKEFMATLDRVYEQGELNRLVIDEAHCISEWGSTFRKEYRGLGFFRIKYPEIPIMALTGSATPFVQNDIIESLALSRDHLYKCVEPFNRGNLFYEVRYRPYNDPSRIDDVLQFINGIQSRGPVNPNDPKEHLPVCGIIYARTRATCDVIKEHLRKNGVRAGSYHRGYHAKTLEKTMNGWMGDPKAPRIDVMVATIAFGMGIDKPNVRYVIHFDLPKSFEGYYQETGRAGRDGGISKCLLYYSREDLVKVRKLVNAEQGSANKRKNMPIGGENRITDSLQALEDLAESTTICRHISICRFFGEKVDEKDPEMKTLYCNRMCDICNDPSKVKKRKSRLTAEELVATQRLTLERAASLDKVDLDQEDPMWSSRRNTGIEDDVSYPGPARPVVAVPSRTESPPSSPGRSLIPLSRPSLGSSRALTFKVPTTLEAAVPKYSVPSLLRAPVSEAPESSAPDRPVSRKRPRNEVSRTAGASPSLPAAPQPARIARKSSSQKSFKTPFKQPSSPPPPSSSPIGDLSEYENVKVEMSFSQKRITPELRNATVQQLSKKMTRALVEEPLAGKIWDAIAAKDFKSSTGRRKVVIKAAKHLEADLLSMTVSEAGYGERYNALRRSISLFRLPSIIKRLKSLSPEQDDDAQIADLVKALKTSYREVHKNKLPDLDGEDEGDRHLSAG